MKIEKYTTSNVTTAPIDINKENIRFHVHTVSDLEISKRYWVYKLPEFASIGNIQIERSHMVGAENIKKGKKDSAPYNLKVTYHFPEDSNRSQCILDEKGSHDSHEEMIQKALREFSGILFSNGDAIALSVTMKTLNIIEERKKDIGYLEESILALLMPALKHCITKLNIYADELKKEKIEKEETFVKGAKITMEEFDILCNHLWVQNLRFSTMDLVKTGRVFYDALKEHIKGE